MITFAESIYIYIQLFFMTIVSTILFACTCFIAYYTYIHLLPLCKWSLINMSTFALYISNDFRFLYAKFYFLPKVFWYTLYITNLLTLLIKHMYLHSFTSVVNPLFLLAGGGECRITVGMLKAFLIRGIFSNPVCAKETKFVDAQ